MIEIFVFLRVVVGIVGLVVVGLVVAAMVGLVAGGGVGGGPGPDVGEGVVTETHVRISTSNVKTCSKCPDSAPLVRAST